MSTVNEVALTESRSMRAATIGRTDVLDKVKALALLPDGIHVTTETVAGYYEVGVDAIESVVRRNREELTANEMRVLKGADLRAFYETANLTASSRRSSLRLFTRTTLLNVGMLLAESVIARQVRTYLLDKEAEAAPAFPIPTTYADALELAARQARELAELAATNAKLSPKARVADQYSANPGITPTVFHKTHFPEVGERDFFEHLYRKDYLIDQRNTRWDEAKQEWKDGPEHGHPAAKGKRYFYLMPRLDRNGVRRVQTLVTPGDAEHDLVAALERDGMPSRRRPSLFVVEAGDRP